MTEIDDGIKAHSASWTFEGIADSFDAHVLKSIPLYELGHDLICKLSDFFLPPEATVIELSRLEAWKVAEE